MFNFKKKKNIIQEESQPPKKLTILDYAEAEFALHNEYEELEKLRKARENAEKNNSM